MPQQKTKIAIIENQITHFKEICDRLAAGGEFIIIPTEDTYEETTNFARIYLDTRYPKMKTESARDELKKFLEGDGIDLIIIDHVLLGFTLDSTMNPDGIQLISDLWKQSERIKKIPVIFLSSSHPNDPTVLRRRQEINNDDTIRRKPEWLYKKPLATSGPIGDRSYFKQFVIPTIKKLVENAKSLTRVEDLAEKLTALSGSIFKTSGNNNLLWQKRNKYQKIIDSCDFHQSDSYLKNVEQLVGEIKKNCPSNLNIIAELIEQFPILENTKNP